MTALGRFVFLGLLVEKVNNNQNGSEVVYVLCPLEKKAKVNYYFNKLADAAQHDKLELETIGERIGAAVERSLVVHLSAKL